MNEEIYVYIIDLESSVPEVVTENPDGSYSVFLNARYSYERQRESYRHACRHIERCDFERLDVQMIEKEAHKQNRLPAAKQVR